MKENTTSLRQSLKIRSRSHKEAWTIVGLALALLTFISPSLAFGAEVSGRVLDTGGQPMSGIPILIERLPREYRAHGQALNDDRIAPPVSEGMTDGNGRFSLDSNGYGVVKVVVRATGHATFSYDVYPLLEPRVLPDLTLRPEKMVKVKVLSPKGQPIPRAYVRLALPEEGTWSLERSLWITDESGMVEISLPQTEVVVEAWHPSFLSSETIWNGGAEISLRLRRGFRRELHLSDTAADLKEAKVVVDGKWPLALSIPAEPLVFAVPENSKLRLTLATAGGFRFETKLGKAPSKTKAAERFEWELPTIMSWTGYVVDHKTGMPIYDALAWSEENQSFYKRTNEKGAFVLGMPLLPFELKVAAAGYDTKSLSFEGTSEEARKPRRLIRLHANRTIRGVVLNAFGKPSVNTKIRPMDSNGRWTQPEGVTDEKGKFEIGPVGASAIVAFPEGLAPSFAKVEDGPVTLQVKEGRVVVGKVVDETGAPLVSAEVAIWPVVEGEGRWIESPLQAVKVNGKGEFRFEDVPKSSFDLEAKAEGYALISYTSKDEGEKEITLTLRKLTEEDRNQIHL